MWTFYRIGGTTMHFMLLCSIAAVTVIVERAWAYKKASLDPAEFITRVRDAILKGGAKAGLAICDEEAYAHKAVSNVTKNALLKFDEAPEDLEKAVENSAVTEVARLEKFLPVLATVANVGPIFGFLGTVTGMISSFDAIAKYGMTNPALVAKGISEALITTATGLFIALFSQPFYNYYTARVTRFIREMEASSNVLLETHGELRRGKRS
jgi:biopolymer transport protein ExbB